MNEKIVFKYHPNVYQNDIVTEGEGICECCGNDVTEYYTTMYCAESIECICLECILNGKAAEKFDGQFIQDAEINKVSDQEKIEELFKRTPGYTSWQGEYENVREYLDKAGSMAGYLFKCLHCNKYHLWVDAD